MIKNPVPWPNGAKCAAAITFDIDTDSAFHLAFREQAGNKLGSMSELMYDEVAIPRILDMYREFGLKQTFFYPGWCMERYPHLVEMILEGGHEIGAHGYLHENPNDYSKDREHYWLSRQIGIMEKMTGKRPRGWRAPLYNVSKHSVDLLVEEGIVYDASMMADDVPYLLQAKKGSILELPTHWSVDDWPQYMHSIDYNYMMSIRSPDEAMGVFMAEFEAMYDYGGFWCPIWHPFVSGRLARCHRIKKMIEHMLNKGGVWFASMEEIARHVQSCMNNGSWSPRVHKMPYYDEAIPELKDLEIK